MPKPTKEEIVAAKRAEEAQRGLSSQHDDNKVHCRPPKDNTLEKTNAAVKYWEM